MNKRPGGQKQEVTNLWLVLTESHGWADSGYTHNCGTEILIKGSSQATENDEAIPYCPLCETEPTLMSEVEYNSIAELSERVISLVHKTILRLSRWRDEELDNALRDLEKYFQEHHPDFCNYVDFLYRYDFTNKLIAIENIISDLTADKLSRFKVSNIAPVDLLRMLDEKLRAIWNNQRTTITA